MRVAPFEILEANRAQQLARSLEIGRHLETPHLDLEEDIAQHVAPVDEDIALKDHADIGLRPADSLALADDRAIGAVEQPGDDQEQGALAAA